MTEFYNPKYDHLKYSEWIWQWNGEERKNEGFGIKNSLRKENRTLGAGGTIINELHPCHKSLKKRGERKPGFKKKKVRVKKHLDKSQKKKSARVGRRHTTTDLRN